MHAFVQICVDNKTFCRGSFQPLGETKLKIKMEKRFRVTHQSTVGFMALRMLLSATVLEVSLLIKKAFILAILPMALNVKGYPHLLANFHNRLQVYI